jgi:hypothetical protein
MAPGTINAVSPNFQAQHQRHDPVEQMKAALLLVLNTVSM